MTDSNPTIILVHDVGTTGNKACLYQVGKTLELVDSHVVEYPIYVLENGGVEQNVDEWWAAITQSTRQVLQTTGLIRKPSRVWLSVPRCRVWSWLMKVAKLYAMP